MKKMLTLLMTLFILYYVIQIGYNFFSQGHEINYTIETSEKNIEVREILTINSEEQNNYFFEIKYDNKIIPFKVYNDYLRKEKIVKKVYIYQNEIYTCANLELEGDKFPTDIKCLNNKTNITYLYSSIYGQNPELDRVIKESGYLVGNYTSNDENTIKKDNIIVYQDNFIAKQNVITEAYKGVYLFGKKVTNNVRYIEQYAKDVYIKELSTIVDKFYITPNYNQTHTFDSFNIVNIEKGNTYSINTNYDISFNSYIQGNVNKKIYIIDIENKKQYEIDVVKKQVTLISDGLEAKTYENNEWIKKNINEIIDSRIKFKKEITKVNEKEYEKVELVGSEQRGTYYAYISNNGRYDVYAIYTQSNILNYLFTTTDKDRVFYQKGYLYYLNNEYLMVYGEDVGTKKILLNNEFKFNQNLKYFVY